MTTTQKPGGRGVVSLDALSKQRRDALPEPVTFELSGVEFTLPPIKSLPLDLQERIGSLENGLGLLQHACGRDKVKEMTDAGYTLGDMELIAEEWQRHNGVDPGEFQASPAS